MYRIAFAVAVVLIACGGSVEFAEADPCAPPDCGGAPTCALSDGSRWEYTAETPARPWLWSHYTADELEPACVLRGDGAVIRKR